MGFFKLIPLQKPEIKHIPFRKLPFSLYLQKKGTHTRTHGLLQWIIKLIFKILIGVHLYFQSFLSVCQSTYNHIHLDKKKIIYLKLIQHMHKKKKVSLPLPAHIHNNGPTK